MDEVIPVRKIAVGLGTVRKVKKGFKVVHFGMIDVGQQPDPVVIFHEQAFLNHFGDIGAGKLHSVDKTGLNFGKIVALLAAHFANDQVHVFLGGHNDPGAATAFGGKAFGDGLQIGHQLHVFGDVLPNFVNEEVQPEFGGLPIDIGLNLIGEVLDGYPILISVFIKNPRCCCFRIAGCLGIGFCDTL